jgi:hypothetical protein
MNNLINLDESLFENCSDLERLFLDSNSISILAENIFKNLINLKLLFVSTIFQKNCHQKCLMAYQIFIIWIYSIINLIS